MAYGECRKARFGPVHSPNAYLFDIVCSTPPVSSLLLNGSSTTIGRRLQLGTVYKLHICMHSTGLG